MDISEVRVVRVPGREDKLRAFCSLTIDGELAIRELRLIEGPGRLFVAMPSRKVAERCPSCGSRNVLRAKFCDECGSRLPARMAADTRLHADIVHPIHAEARARLEGRIVEAYREALERPPVARAPADGLFV